MDCLYLTINGLLAIGATVSAYCAWRSARNSFDSMKLAREQHDQRVARDAAVLGLQLALQSRRELDHNAAILISLASHGVPKYDGPVGDFSPASLDDRARTWLTLLNTAAKRQGQCPDNVVLQAQAAINNLEAIAAPFTTAVADHRVGAALLSDVFIEQVGWFYPFLVTARTNPRWPNAADNTIALYETWKAAATLPGVEQTAQLLRRVVDETEKRKLVGQS